jgi:alanyl-tRNA synthetase
MTARELRQKYLQFFESKGHSIYPSGSLIPYDVTGRLDESLLFNGAGMVQFKPFFRGVATPPNKRLTNAQKCVRTGDIESVGDLSHLTFFEMLGNFSFGDYFKAEAIRFSWEFLTSPDWLGLDPKRLSFTVFEEDDEAYNTWAELVRSVGIDPETRVFRLGEETNYWPAGAFSSGPPGPCGPNSEMFYWTSNDVPPPPTRLRDAGAGGGESPYTVEHWLADDEAKNWLEIWNDVFIQYEWQGELKNPDRPNEGFRKTGMPQLPFRSVDTGMGLERTTAVLNGLKSVYDTDLFAPILGKLNAIYAETRQDWSYGQNEEKDTAARIIADHIRTACFCIADGILPGNSGRGYVLRRLIRRAVLKGQRVLGFEQPFFHLVYEGVVEAMGDHYRELVDRRAVIVETLKNEEALFRRTVHSGSEMLGVMLAEIDRGGTLSGEDAFRLYDTYGFPLEVTQEICEEAGVGVDIDGYLEAMKEAQERSRASSGMETVYGGVAISFTFTVQSDDGKPTPTEFLGYEATEADAHIVGAIPVRNDAGELTGELAIALDRTPFYAESGGQVSDTGVLRYQDIELKVVDISKQDNVYVHLVELGPNEARHGVLRNEQLNDLEGLNKALYGVQVRAVVDQKRRRSITRNHTATHLLHAALRKVLGAHVMQAGSQVAADALRFDFTHGKALSPAELAEIEQLVYEHVLAAEPMRIYAGVPIDEARQMGAMALFGEKYGDRVRVVQVGDMDPGQASFSRELCGGIHVRNTGEIGMFKIVHEASAASGVRRIEALTGEGAYRWALGQQQTVKEAAERLKSTPNDVLAAIDKMAESLKEERKRVEKLRSSSAQATQAEAIPLGAVELVAQRAEDMDAKEATLIADRLADNQPKRVTLVASVADGKVTFICKVGAEALAAGAHAGNLVKALAQIVGGGGGGRPDFATAGGKNAAALDEALSAAQRIVAEQVGAQG